MFHHLREPSEKDDPEARPAMLLKMMAVLMAGALSTLREGA